MDSTGAPTIDIILTEFLAEQRDRLSARTFANYEDVVRLLRSSLDGYGPNSLDGDEFRRWERAYESDEEAFCHLFGPEKIPEHLGEFLGYFMVRKVFAGQELLKASGTVTKKLVRWLEAMALAVIGRAGFPLRSQAKRKIRRWLQEAQPYAAAKGPELQLSDVVVIRLDPAFRDAFKQLRSYRDGRERFIESNPEIRQGEPVIAGTRLPVRAVAERVKGEDTIDDLTEDYPHIPRKAFQTALIYAQSHPRRGRPARPWRDA